MHFDSNDDTLRRYLDDIRQTAPLNRISEQTYFQLIQEAREIKANPNATKKELADAEAKHKHGCEALISANMRFVRSSTATARFPCPTSSPRGRWGSSAPSRASTPPAA